MNWPYGGAESSALVGRTGFEPVTHGLKAFRSTRFYLRKRTPIGVLRHVCDAHEKGHSSHAIIAQNRNRRGLGCVLLSCRWRSIRVWQTVFMTGESTERPLARNAYRVDRRPNVERL